MTAPIRLPQPLEAGCVLYLPLWEGAGAVAGDLSGFNNHGAITGGTWVPGINNGYSLSFNGVSDYINVPDTDILDEIRTFEARAYVPEEHASGTSFHIIVHKYSTYRVGLYFNYNQSPNTIYLGWIDSLGTISNISYVITEYAKWYHLIGMLNDDMQSELIVNGVSKGIGAGVLADNNNATFLSNPVRIGGGAINRYSFVTIDEVACYNRPLTYDEAFEHYYRSKR